MEYNSHVLRTLYKMYTITNNYWTLCCTIQGVIVLTGNLQSAMHFTLIQFWNYMYLCNYSLNCTPLCHLQITLFGTLTFHMIKTFKTWCKSLQLQHAHEEKLFTQHGLSSWILYTTASRKWSPWLDISGGRLWEVQLYWQKPSHLFNMINMLYYLYLTLLLSKSNRSISSSL